ncbi:MAG: four helix bundle protein [bacterium]
MEQFIQSSLPIAKLKVWQESINLVKQIYLLTRKLPKEELYCLTPQLRRAVISIPSNLAEGQQKHSQKDFLRYIDIALGSTAEIRTQLIVAREIYNVNIDLEENLAEAVSKMLHGLRKTILSNINSEISAEI